MTLMTGGWAWWVAVAACFWHPRSSQPPLSLGSDLPCLKLSLAFRHPQCRGQASAPCHVAREPLLPHPAPLTALPGFLVFTACCGAAA